MSCELDLSSNGLRSISSQLRKYGYETDLIFLTRFNEPYTERILENVRELVKGSDVIGFSCMNRSSKNVIQIINHLRSKACKQPIVWGGIYATLNPHECLKYADLVCVGEGEEAMLDLVRAIDRGGDVTEIKNLWVKKGDKLYRNDVRPLIEDVNKLPFEDYNFKNHYVLKNENIISLSPDHMRYHQHNISNEFFSIIRGKFISIHTVRGCLYDCAYCCNYDLKRIYANKGSCVRKRDVRNVIAALMNLKSMIPGLEFIWFTDDDFLIRKKKELEVFAKLYKEKIGLKFMCYITPTTLDEEKLKVLRNARLNRVEVGVQSGSERFNKEVYKRSVSNKVVVDASRMLNKYFRWTYPPEYQVICSNPFETKEDVLETIELIQKLQKPFFLRVFNMVFFPGSYMWKKAVRMGVVRDDAESCASFAYSDIVHHLNAKKTMPKEVLYLNALLNLMRGDWNSIRCGRIPKVMLKLLLNEKVMSLVKDSDVLIRMLNFAPYGISFWKLPYSVKMSYLRFYHMFLREFYITPKRWICRSRYRFNQLKLLLSKSVKWSS